MVDVCNPKRPCPRCLHSQIGSLCPARARLPNRPAFRSELFRACLNNKDGVSDDVRRRVLEVAQELNYSPAKRLPLPVVNMTHIGLLVRPLGENLMASPFYGDVYHGVEEICSERRINLSFSSVDAVEGRVRNLPTLVADERIGGLVAGGGNGPLCGRTAGRSHPAAHRADR